MVVGTFADVIVVGIIVMGPERAAFCWWLVEAGRRVAPFAGRSVALAHVDYRVDVHFDVVLMMLSMSIRRSVQVLFA